MDLHTLKTEYLEAVQTSHEHIQQLCASADLVLQGGVEDVQEVARDCPEAILAAFAAMRVVILQLETEKLQLIEDYFEALDREEKS